MGINLESVARAVQPKFSAILMFGRLVHAHKFPPDLVQPERVMEIRELSQRVSVSSWAVPLPDGFPHVSRPSGSQ